MKLYKEAKPDHYDFDGLSRGPPARRRAGGGRKPEGPRAELSLKEY